MSTANRLPTASANEPEYVEEAAYIVFEITLAGNQQIKRVPVPIDRDSDFEWTAINGSSDGDYTLNPTLPSGRYLCTSEIAQGNFVSPAANQPTTIGPPALYRAGSSGPLLDLTETSGSSNVIKLVFSGIRRLRSA